MASPNPLQIQDAVAKAHNLIFAQGYAAHSSVPNTFVKGSTTLHVDPQTGVARKVTSAGGNELLLATVRLADDVQASLTAIL
jgi:hypothetical protein